jgi:hypothetical protein
MGADYQRLGGLNGRVQRSSLAERCLQTEVVWALTVIAETVATATERRLKEDGKLIHPTWEELNVFTVDSPGPDYPIDFATKPPNHRGWRL